MVSSMSDHQWKLSATIRYVALVSSVSMPGRTKRILQVFFGHLNYWQHSCCPRGYMAIEPESRSSRGMSQRWLCLWRAEPRRSPLSRQSSMFEVRLAPSRAFPNRPLVFATKPMIAWSSCLLLPRSFSFTIVCVGKQDHPRWIWLLGLYI